MKPPEERHRGRPRVETPRSVALMLKLTPEEMEAIERKAKASKKPKARWVRELALAA